jgi:hypothetical protein
MAPLGLRHRPSIVIVVAHVHLLAVAAVPIEREPADAWADFVGWRINYEQAAYAVAAAVDAVPALWSGPRPHGGPAIAPIRPPRGRPPK